MPSNSIKKYIDKPITHLDDLPSIEKDWREIYETVSNNSIFISFDYIVLWYQSFAQPEQVRIYPVYEGNTLIGFLPLIFYKKGLTRILSSLTNSHCYHPAALIAGGYEDIFLKNCFDKILAEKGEWDLFKYQYYSFHKTPDLKRCSEINIKITENARPTYSIMLPGSFNEYINHHRSLKNDSKKKKKKLSQYSSYSFCHYTGNKAIDSWDSFLSIEDSGWKGEKGSSIKNLPENYLLYYKSLINLLNEYNKLHMYFLNIDGQPIAGLFCYEDNGILHAWKSGYIEEFSSVSPSNALMLFVIEDLIANFPTIEILHMFPDDYGYKSRFVHEDSFYTLTTLFNKTISGRTAYNFIKFKQRVKLFPGMSSVIEFIRNVK